MKKSIFVYFSYSGDNDQLATILKRKLNCDTLKLEPIKNYTDNSIKILFQGGHESVSKKLPALKPYVFDPNDYEIIIIATPVWAWTFSPVLRSFLNDNQIINKKIILLCSHRGNPGKTIKHLTEKLPNNQIIYTHEIHAPIKDNENIKKLTEDIIFSIKHNE